MSEIPSKVGMFIWKLKNCEGGDPEKMANVAFEAGLSHVLIKVNDGVWKYNMRPYYNSAGHQLWADDLIGPVVEAFREKGIQVYGWQYVYLSNPAAEAAAAVERVKQFKLDGFVIDIEAEGKAKRGTEGAYLAGLKNIGVPVALSTYRWPTYHRELPWEAYMTASQVMMPQVYWMQATNAAAQLERSFIEYNQWQGQYGLPRRPFVPTGAAFSEWGWNAKAIEVTEFLKKAVALKLPGVNFWEWSFARRLPGLWDAIATFRWPDSTPTPPPTTVSVDAFVREQVYPMMKDKMGYSGPKPV